MSQSAFGKAIFGIPRTTNGVSALSGKPTAVFPGGIATDSTLTIAVNRVQTRLAVPLDTVSTVMSVVDASLIVANMQISIDAEIVKTTAAPTGTQVPISRGFDGTTPATHLSGAAVSGFIDAWHHNALAAEIEAIETALGPNLGNLQASQFVINAPFVFTQSPGGNLIAGANVITLTPVPAGITASDSGHYLYISGGTGTAEAVPIIGGNAVSGAATGTVIVTCANTHSGAWTISSATGGIQEAVSSLPAHGGLVLIVSDVTLYADVSDMGKTYVAVWKLPGPTFTDPGNFKILHGFALNFDRQYYFQNYPPTSAKLYGGARFDMGGFPDAYRFGGNNIAATESLVGTISIPTTDARGGIHSGVAGYATTYSTMGADAANAVGVLGLAMIPVKNGAIWGSNFVVDNIDTDLSGSLIFGCEIDINHAITTGLPATNIIGCMLVNNCNTKPTQTFIGYSCRLSNDTTNKEMTTAFESAIGAAAHALWVGMRAPVPGTVSNSQDIHFDSCNGTINPAGTMWMDSNGNIFIGCDEQDTVNVTQGGGFRIKPRTFATLPTAPNLTEGISCPITDCNTATIGAVAGGGGTTHAMLYYNGTNWKVMCA